MSLSYTQTEWLLLFFVYCVLGWVWESCYVSVRKGAWVNRGFLYGPWLPIYGSGAIAILLATLGVTASPPLVFLLGMIAATILEYVTGAVMEALFHMRYWDYSDHRFNLDGYICLDVSLGWGCFSLFLVYILHPPIQALVRMIPEEVSQAITFVCTVLFVVDATKSTQAALGLKELMQKLTESSQHLENLEAHMAAAMEHLSESSAHQKERLHQAEAALSQRREERREEHSQAKAARTQNRRDYLLEKLTEQRDHKSRLLTRLEAQSSSALVSLAQKLAQDPEPQEKARLEKAQSMLRELQTSLRRAEADMAARKNREFQRAVSILYRNPSAVSSRYQRAFSQLRRMTRPTPRGKDRKEP